MILYHLTDGRKVRKILREGLMPGTGRNSARISDDRDGAVCLCQEQSLPFWRIILPAGALLEIDLPGLPSTAEYVGYSDYSEYRLFTKIHPEHIRRIPLPSIDLDAMRKLCLGSLEDLSTLCRLAADCHYYACRSGPGHSRLPNGYSGILDRYAAILSSVCAIGPRLNYKSVPSETYLGILAANSIQGEYTFADRYAEPEYSPDAPRLWEMLGSYNAGSVPKLERLVPMEIRVKRIIKHAFDKAVLYAETGGWSK